MSPAFEPESAAIRDIGDSLDRLGGWVERAEYRAYDPGDGQLSYLRHLTFGSPRLQQILTAVVLRSPFNIRPLLGIRPHTSTKGMGYMAWGYLRRFKATGHAIHAARARKCLDWLLVNRSPGQTEMCWGNAFTFTTRAGSIPTGQPTIVWSSLIGQAFVEAYELFGDQRYLDAAESTCNWILRLPRETTETGDCLSYVESKQVSIHNSNMLGAALLARVGTIKGRADAIEVARQAMRYSCERQLTDGSWYYGEEPKFHWIDSFHTGYNLDSLRRYIDSTNDLGFDEHLRRGYEYFKRHFFEPDGRTRYMHDRLMPIDIQCAAQAIDTLAFFSDRDPQALPLARRVARWTIANMQSPDGSFYYRDLGWKKIRTEMFHWGQGTMFKALAHVVEKSNSAPVEHRPRVTANLAPDKPLTYVLVTPARNEEAYIGKTIQSVVAQTHRPHRWVIVSDGSTDRTNEIVELACKEHDWIELVRMPERRERQFAAKANAFNAGYERLKQLQFDIVGNLDADITFDPYYFEFLIGRFALDPELGVAGTPYVDDHDKPHVHTYAHKGANISHVSGACQMFRRECFESIGGYTPVKIGAIDWIAVTTARMKGWKTRTFLDKVNYHHRKVGTAERSPLQARYEYGRKAYSVGGHPAWELVRTVSQMRSPTGVLGGLYYMAGYVSGSLASLPRSIPPELVTFHRHEQLNRLKQLIRTK